MFKASKETAVTTENKIIYFTYQNNSHKEAAFTQMLVRQPITLV